MLTAREFQPMVEDAQRVKEETARDPDKTLRQNAEKAFCEIFIAQRHALLAERRMFEAGMARTYSEMLSASGQFRLAERERVRAANLEQQSLNHQHASEVRQATGDELETEAVVVLSRRAKEQKPPNGQPQPPQGGQQPPPGRQPSPGRQPAQAAPAAPPAAAAPEPHRRQRDQPGNDG